MDSPPRRAHHEDAQPLHFFYPRLSSTSPLPIFFFLPRPIIWAKCAAISHCQCPLVDGLTRPGLSPSSNLVKVEKGSPVPDPNPEAQRPTHPVTLPRRPVITHPVPSPTGLSIKTTGCQILPAFDRVSAPSCVRPTRATRVRPLSVLRSSVNLFVSAAFPGPSSPHPAASHPLTPAA